MRRLTEAFRTLAITVLLISAVALSDTTKPGFVVDEELLVSGEVEQVLEVEDVAILVTAYGARVDVSLDALAPWATGQAGYQELEPGLLVTARMNPGLVSVAPASEGRMWIKVDGKEFVRLHPRDLNDELFHDDSRVVDDIEISLAEKLKVEALKQPTIEF